MPQNLIMGFFVVAIVFMLVWMVNIPWLVHRDMTLSYVNSSKGVEKGTFEDFLKEFEKVKKWDRDNLYPESFFDYKNENHIHASLIEFHGVHMLLNPIDFCKFQKWICKNKLVVPKKIIKKWR